MRSSRFGAQKRTAGRFSAQSDTSKMSSPSAQLGVVGYGGSGLHAPATVVQAPRPSSPMSQADTIPAAEGADRSWSVAAAARSLPRRMWQPDLEAEQCSLLTCGTKFAWPKERRHHCRQCGRVVCAACSNRTVIPPSAPPEPCVSHGPSSAFDIDRRPNHLRMRAALPWGPASRHSFNGRSGVVCRKPCCHRRANGGGRATCGFARLVF